MLLLLLVELISGARGWLPKNFPATFDPSLFNTSVARILPKDFIHGYASAAFQVEGAVREDGKSESIWDRFSNTPGKIYQGHSANVSDDEYHRYAETIDLLKKSGANSYRMSISWPRLIPGGFSGSPVNQKAVNHYNKIFDLLHKNNIQPFVTLYHWDLPQVLQDRYEGLMNFNQFSQDFVYFADTAFRIFGPKVKYWLTFNEPTSYCILGYQTGDHAPGYCTDRKRCAKGNGLVDVFKCFVSTIIAHAKAVDVYRKKYQPQQQGLISIAPNIEYGEPLNPKSPIDRFFAELT